jgi:hypothetical protein
MSLTGPLTKLASSLPSRLVAPFTNAARLGAISDGVQVADYIKVLQLILL